MARICCTAGRLLWRWVRYPVDLEKAAGHDVHLVESPGMLEREFVIYGPVDSLTRIRDAWKRRFGHLIE